MHRIEVVEGKCIGAGNCVDVAEDYFDQGDDALVIVLKEQVPEGDVAEVERAVKACPVAALRLLGA
ncbi:MAG: ferredoxin [Cryobacterium sp.]|nr:ferredoxin [Cryobacterium sp.]